MPSAQAIGPRRFPVAALRPRRAGRGRIPGAVLPKARLIRAAGDGALRYCIYNGPMILNSAAYHFVSIADPGALASQLHAWAEAGQLRGTSLVAGEGINLFLAGKEDAVHAFYDQLRADPRFTDLPIIAMTAHAMDGDAQKSLAAGMNAHLTKPINSVELFQTLAQWLPVPPRGQAA